MYAKHCQDWVNVEQPLWRYSLTGNSDGGQRETRERTRFKGGTGVIMDWIFSQPAWKGYPHRKQSVFCSTTQNTEVGPGDSDTMFAIYPYDGNNIAQTDDIDFNYIKPFDGVDHGSRLTDASYILRSAIDASVSTMRAYNHLKAMVNSNFGGGFTPAAEFNEWFENDFKSLLDDDEVSDINKSQIRHAIKQFEERLTPEHMGCKHVTPAEIDFHKQHEVWFEGKYLMIPQPKLPDFINAVKELSK